MNIEKELITSLPYNYQNNRLHRYSSTNFDLKGLILNMKHDKKWKSGEMSMMILQRDPAKKIVLTILHEGTEICSSQVNDSITFQVIGGKLMLNFLKESYILNSGDVMELNEKTRYSIDSIEETSFLMTLNS
jgi:hypothetical protein